MVQLVAPSSVLKEVRELQPRDKTLFFCWCLPPCGGNRKSVVSSTQTPMKVGELRKRRTQCATKPKGCIGGRRDESLRPWAAQKAILGGCSQKCDKNKNVSTVDLSGGASLVPPATCTTLQHTFIQCCITCRTWHALTAGVTNFNGYTAMWKEL